LNRERTQLETACTRRAWLRAVLGAAVGVVSRTQSASAAASRKRRQIVVNPQQALNLKGTYVYSFCKFVSWPAGVFVNDKTPVIIGVLGDDALLRTLESVAEKRKNLGRPLDVRRLAGPDEAKTCHLVCIGAAVDLKSQLEAIDATKELPVVIVTESPNMMANGAHFNFFLNGASINFEINVKAVRAGGFSMNPQLTALRVAKLVP
jgi:hypothetical protein